MSELQFILVIVAVAGGFYITGWLHGNKGVTSAFERGLIKGREIERLSGNGSVTP